MSSRLRRSRSQPRPVAGDSTPTRHLLTHHHVDPALSDGPLVSTNAGSTSERVTNCRTGGTRGTSPRAPAASGGTTPCSWLTDPCAHAPPAPSAYQAQNRGPE